MLADSPGSDHAHQPRMLHQAGEVDVLLILPVPQSTNNASIHKLEPPLGVLRPGRHVLVAVAQQIEHSLPVKHKGQGSLPTLVGLVPAPLSPPHPLILRNGVEVPIPLFGIWALFEVPPQVLRNDNVVLEQRKAVCIGVAEIQLVHRQNPVARHVERREMASGGEPVLTVVQVVLGPIDEQAGLVEPPGRQ